MVTPRIAALAKRLGGKFDEEDFGLWPELYQAASQALEGRTAPHPLPYSVAARILNGLLAIERQPQPVEPAPVVTDDEEETFDLTTPTFRSVFNGFYTVEFPDGSYRTLRVSAWPKRGDGVQMVAYLDGPDNTNNYRGFAEITPNGPRIWNSFRGDSAIVRALDVLTQSEDRSKLTEGYARRAGRCARCNRLITRPESLTNGMGEECWSKAA